MVMNTINKFILFILLFWASILSGQNWPVVIGDNIFTTNSSISEDYDKGYLLSNWNYLNASYTNYGWLVKTDINGNILWTKTYGDGEYAMYFSKAIRTTDNGILISGSIGKYDNVYSHDPLFLKLNPCGEVEWCTVLRSELGNGDDYGTGIIELVDGSFIGMIKYYGHQIQTIRISLIKMDAYGFPLWIQHLAQEDSTVSNEEGYDLTLTSDSNYLVSGHRNGPQPYFIMCDTLGNEDWALTWDETEITGGSIDEVVEKDSGVFYACGGGRSPGTRMHPALYKIDAEGNELYYKLLLGDTITGGGAGPLGVLNDTTLAIGFNWRINPNPNIGNSSVATIDTLGNVIKQRLLVEQHLEPANIIKTFDDKIVVTGHYFLDGNWDVYLWKMNHDLEDDSIYTQARVYDSLCPYPIVSDTIDLDCGLYVDIGDIPTRKEYENPLKVFPNPASNTIHLLTKTGSGKEVIVFDIFGKQIIKMRIPNTGEQQIDVSGWSDGLYLFSLFEKGVFIKSGKVIVN